MKRVIIFIFLLALVQNFTACTSRSVVEVCVTKVKAQLLPRASTVVNENVQDDNTDEEFHPLMMLSIHF
jgi:hypothetical protein